ncbi:unnamed protein product [Rangifer tarandus platyrhynchus]|uniref:Uncharacterized protein n=1 Tax=Rangifer tarandus platyrhynchus TaxID=3082113 RepID=A0ABN8ZDM6_RANTA|nr:unnamed protein product [Rangifer tarandus platyrhynchus]
MEVCPSSSALGRRTRHAAEGRGRRAKQRSQTERGQSAAGPGPGLYGGYRVGAPGRGGGRWRREAAPRLSSLAFSESSRPGALGGGGAGAGLRVRLAAARMLCAPPRALGGLPLPARPLEAGPTPTPPGPTGTRVLWARPGSGALGGGGRALPSRELLCYLEGSDVFGGHLGRAAERTVTGHPHTVWPLGGREEPAVSPGLEGAAGRARCADSGLPLPRVGGSGVTLRLFPDGTEARNFVSFLP